MYKEIFSWLIRLKSNSYLCYHFKKKFKYFMQYIITINNENWHIVNNIFAIVSVKCCNKNGNPLYFCICWLIFLLYFVKTDIIAETLPLLQVYQAPDFNWSKILIATSKSGQNPYTHIKKYANLFSETSSNFLQIIYNLKKFTFFNSLSMNYCLKIKVDTL